MFNRLAFHYHCVMMWCGSLNKQWLLLSAQFKQLIIVTEKWYVSLEIGTSFSILFRGAICYQSLTFHVVLISYIKKLKFFLLTIHAKVCFHKHTVSVNLKEHTVIKYSSKDITELPWLNIINLLYIWVLLLKYIAVIQFWEIRLYIAVRLKTTNLILIGKLANTYSVNAGKFDQCLHLSISTA